MFSFDTKAVLTASIVAVFGTINLAHAATVTTVTVETSSDFGGAVSASDSNIDADSAAATFGASGIQNVDGSSSVSTQAVQPFAGREINVATASLVQSATNNSGALQGYSFTFSLFDLALQVQETYGYSPYIDYSNPFENAGSDAAANKISYDVLLDGVSVYSASIELFGGIDSGFNIENVENFTYTEEDVLDPFSGTDVIGKRVVINDLTETLFLGNFADGESLTLETVLRSESQATNYEGEQSAGAFFGDPSGLAANGLVTQVAPQTNVVPLPAAAWMLLAGLGGLGALKRRKTA